MPTEQEKQWIAAWRRAAPELERIRNEELRKLDESSGMKLMGAGEDRSPEVSGLVAFQAWMMRLRAFELMRSPDGS